MSAPKTNIEKQKRRHSPALIGMAIAAAFVLLASAILLPRGIDDAGEGRTAAGSVDDGSASTATN